MGMSCDICSNNKNNDNDDDDNDDDDSNNNDNNDISWIHFTRKKLNLFLGLETDENAPARSLDALSSRSF